MIWDVQLDASFCQYRRPFATGRYSTCAMLGLQNMTQELKQPVTSQKKNENNGLSYKYSDYIVTSAPPIFVHHMNIYIYSMYNYSYATVHTSPLTTMYQEETAQQITNKKCWIYMYIYTHNSSILALFTERKPIGTGCVILASFRNRLSQPFRDQSLAFRGHTLFAQPFRRTFHERSTKMCV